MNILIIIRNFDFGGAENHVCELANAIYNEGHKVILVSGGGRQQKRLHSGVLHYKIRFSNRNLIFQTIRIIPIIKKHQIDIIHSHQRLPLMAGVILSKICKIPNIGTIHSLLKFDVSKKWIKKGLDSVIVVSKNSFKGAMQDPILASKTTCILNGINIPNEKILVNPDKLNICYISRMDLPHTKMIKFLITKVWPAFVNQYPNAKLSIIGDGRGMSEIKRTLKYQVDKQTNKSIKLLGYKPRISTEIKKSNLVLGVGRIALESLSLGVPVLSVKSNRLGSIITTDNFEQMQYGNFVAIDSKPPTKNKLIAALENFANNREFYIHETLEVSGKLKNTHNIQLTTTQTLKVYLKRLNKPYFRNISEILPNYMQIGFRKAQ